LLFDGAEQMKRREFLRQAGIAALLPYFAKAAIEPVTSTLVNDVQTELNLTRVDRVIKVRSDEDVISAIRLARDSRHSISIAGGRHAAGGQQFGSGTILLDTTSMNRAVSLDLKSGKLEVDAGIEWPDLVKYTLDVQQGTEKQWAIAQKQGGGDRFAIGGALSANAHGHTLNRMPIVGDVDSIVLIDASGNRQRCSRAENSELFRLAIGGYGLFGILTSVTLQLVPRQKVERNVEWAVAEDVIEILEKRSREGHLFGDFQYSIDDRSEDYMRKGILTTYRPVALDMPVHVEHSDFSEKEYTGLLVLAHENKKDAFARYAESSLAMSGQVYWSDLNQMSPYPLHYHRAVERFTKAKNRGVDMITEVYVPRSAFPEFLGDVRVDFLKNQIDNVYGTVRMIEKDDQTYLAWARERFACVIFTLHAERTPDGLARLAKTCRAIIDKAANRGGSYYLTYHRYATRKQVERCYPQFAEFLQLKKKYDPNELFQSEWYRHAKKLFANS
jgi:FAD/FMN-containing dehydrogenase